MGSVIQVVLPRRALKSEVVWGSSGPTLALVASVMFGRSRGRPARRRSRIPVEGI